MTKDLGDKSNNKLSGSGLSRTVRLVAIIVGLAVLVFLLLLFFHLKSIYDDVSAGRKNLEYSLTYIEQGNFNKAKQAAGQAAKYFTLAENGLKGLQANILVKNIVFLNDNLSDFRYLAQTAEILSSSAEKALIIVDEVKNMLSGQGASNFSELSDDVRFEILKKFYENYPEWQGLKAKIDLSLVYWSKISDNNLLRSQIGSWEELENKLLYLSKSLSQVVSLSALIPVLSGYPEPVSYLILLQNNNELRPSGGFIGTYGILEIASGRISRLETHDVYHLDMPASLNPDFKVEPPAAIKKYLASDRWYLRDANWWPDWPTSAKKIQWFYEQEMIAAGRSAEIVDFSGVVALTPRMITDLLYFVGPIEINHNVYNQDNFVETLQYEVEMAFRDQAISEWDRKEVINDILREIENRLLKLPAESWPELAKILLQNIERKNIQVYFQDDFNQNVSQVLNWSGEIKDQPLDYLMVVDANLAAFKTDRVMEKNIDYFLYQEADGRFRARLELNYKNQGWFDWQTTRYRSFSRVYVPRDSSFLSVSGLSENIKAESDEVEISHPKTYWSGFISLEPSQALKVVFEYYLPESFGRQIEDQRHYSLWLQKQAGSNISRFRAEFNFLNEVKSYSGQGQVEINGRQVIWTNDLDRDYYLDINF